MCKGYLAIHLTICNKNLYNLPVDKLHICNLSNSYYSIFDCFLQSEKSNGSHHTNFQFILTSNREIIGRPINITSLSMHNDKFIKESDSYKRKQQMV